MMKARKRRPVFLSAVILAVLLGSVIIGSTFAYTWQDSVSYTKNAESIGTLDYAVDLKYAKTRGVADNSYASLLAANTAAFNDSMLWCPGRTELVYLQLTNNELFAVDCSLKLNVTNSEFDDVLTYAVEDVLTYAVIDDLKSTSNEHPSSWGNFYANAGVKGVLTEGEHALRSVPVSAESNDKTDKIRLSPNESHFLTLAIHMNEEAPSDYEGKKLEFSFDLHVDANYKPGVDPAKLNREDSDYKEKTSF